MKQDYCKLSINTETEQQYLFSEGHVSVDFITVDNSASVAIQPKGIIGSSPGKYLSS